MKLLIRYRCKEVQEQFEKLDRNSYGELSEDLLYELLKRLVGL